jgi:CheY-like chemotaxis protein
VDTIDPSSSSGGTPTPSPGAARRVLVVEDHADARRLMQRLLQMWGYEAHVAEDGQSGIDAALAHRPDVALIDLGLPVLDGYEVARRIRAALGGGIRLVALTGYSDLDDRDKAARAGFDLHLVKPVHPDRLSQTLADLMEPPPAGPGTP